MKTNVLLTKYVLRQALPKDCRISVHQGTGRSKEWVEATISIPHADGCACDDNKAEVFGLCAGCRFNRNKIVQQAHEAVKGIEYEKNKIGESAIDIKVHFHD